MNDRAAEGRCVVCNEVIVDAWLCDSCGLNTTMHRSIYDERRSVTATTIGRALQRRVDSAAAYEQLIQLQTTTDHGVTPVDHSKGARPDENVVSESTRSRKIRSMARGANAVDRAAFRAAPDASPALFSTPYGYESPRLNVRRAKRLALRWKRFCKMWESVMFRLVDDLTRPVSVTPPCEVRARDVSQHKARRARVRNRMHARTAVKAVRVLRGQVDEAMRRATNG